ncbi:LLM class flavin-dependent oxidoreductase [Marinobacter sp. M3C]|jgi:luciferase family oxidoreductase group 1|uniref:LLM class flavin-dependent oxidoreductase n=1 Tax=unclassified Marinobacter TaxID=83889 RepID=UPI00200E0864|nr:MULTISPECIES: LLM class flavin-dependent oxidoreductase [unclassified Marinobacter]MCL1478472.1 LLM class flavin-dependent oxidoreductase [Marinobacter sp.]MCL1485949.1 LLM class flavin-dependent oxidoreductase [Marinobacter sp.]UQG55975.1 LLM class flavin-dependent oxidoreductase [Marinobacter sp. M4C]UQG58602.1 LLM class flavin-dependent oxidoreductase [Marinobacter sp. M3C]UQG64780.1 LLM class flavin-dependent oxidoreductase [Marinobacter sp. M2C]
MNINEVAFSVLDLASTKDNDEGATPALQRSLTLAKHVEQLGFNRYWVAEHHNMDAIVSSATAVVVGYLAAGTQTIRVGAGGVMLPNHAPIVIAEQFGTLEALYPGRIDLGLGRAPGTDPLTSRALRKHLSGSVDDFPADVEELQAFLGPRQPGQKVVAMPGVDSNVPLWLLGSSLFSAQLAAKKGLPYAFASHFAPRMMMQAIEIYRSQFQPSELLDKPYVMLGVPLVAADTDEQAEFLATTTYQRILSLIRGQSLKMRPPVSSMDGLWSPQEEQTVRDFLGLAMIGSGDTVKQNLQTLLQHTQADELLFTCDLYKQQDRLRSFEILAALKN